MTTKPDLENETYIDVAIRLLLEGNKPADIKELFLIEHKMTPEAAAVTIEMAFDHFAVISSLPKKVRHGWCVEATREVCRKMIATGDLAGAIKAIRQVADFTGVNGPLTKSAEEQKQETAKFIEDLFKLG